MMLEIIALWWCYAMGATAALGLYAVTFLWAFDRLLTAFKVKRKFLEWVFDRGAITTRKPAH